MGAFLNVKINVTGIEDQQFAQSMLSEGDAIQQKAISLESQILEIVNQVISKL
jgi:glutamate formiminotransferase / formiminotetrahydrofolate cyclodeaminase